ncbi:hypothetical protein BATDEDRAFT_28088 [Batrachochytrium dendrobatidis JAM81]|uniref:Succinylglutamate desuccinylase/Aspartoacylase catalytic domain-containing protein n=3 Tax=Batrachochytrium dendrobatidis TaxID=109871 RepID=F4PCT1_BATDJ|nr:uncharacterized protein BATDEDRAFT_28088 [Batrachochytrium dendrobatidis JAM81]EGF76998.1 hypothetical protein BATDEDRAFT_28088 [Batrachochytrium dendrobatidis JAM81]|eukprot:XP_006682402.1 hypothetical protein BATDEDRAFT_28088 [Batrachochytrium dendrobatidis JAM81]
MNPELTPVNPELTSLHPKLTSLHPELTLSTVNSLIYDPISLPPAMTTLSVSTSSLLSEQSCPAGLTPKIQVYPNESYVHLPWKNGLGETAEIAVYPPNRNFRKDPFMWRLSLSEVRDSCSFSLFPGYDIALFLLPESGANAPIRGNLSAPAVLYHNDQATPVPIKPLVPYTYKGEWPTTCSVNASPLKHLTFTSNRRVAKVSMSLETISRHGANGDDGVGDEDENSSDDELLELSSKDSAHPPISNLGSQPTTNPQTTAETTTSPTNRLLLGNFTIVYVVSGSIKVTIEGDSEPRTLLQGQTLVCERDDDCTPSDLIMTPILKPMGLTTLPSHTPLVVGSLNISELPGASQLKEPREAKILLIDIHLFHPDRQGSYIFDSSATDLFNLAASSTAAQNTTTISHGITNVMAQAAQPPLPDVSNFQRGRSGSIIVYDDQPLWVVPKEMDKPAMLADANAHKSNLTTQYWESAHQYRPPVFSARYQNESDVPPPVIRDSLVIEEFPTGKISTVWINMVKQGLSEWLRVPVIIARGTESGPVVGITAVVHGNELNGVPCIHRVISDIDVNHLKGTVVAVPCVNVPGYLRFSREFSDGKDLNRLFPGQESGTASQMYNYHLMNKIINRFNYLIDLHTASFGRVNSYYVRSDMNDPVSAVLAKLQQPQVILHNSGQDGTLRSAASSRGIKAITVEIGNPQLFQNQYVQWSYMGVMRILSYLNMFTSNTPEPNTPQPKTILCSKGFWIYTHTGGVLEVYPQVNSVIRKGDLIARIKNIFGNIVDEIFASSHGVTIGRSSNPVAMAGDRVLHLGIIKKENEVLAREAKENY